MSSRAPTFRHFMFTSPQRCSAMGVMRRELPRVLPDAQFTLLPLALNEGSNFPRPSSALLTSQSATPERLRCPVHDSSSNFLLALPTTRCIITHRDLQPIDCTAGGRSRLQPPPDSLADINPPTIVDSQLNTARGPLNFRIRRRPIAAAYDRNHVERLTQCEECHQRILPRSGESAQWYARSELRPRNGLERIWTPAKQWTATSNDPWGPTGTDMADIAKITYNR